MKKQSLLNILIIDQLGQIVYTESINIINGTSVNEIQTERIPDGFYDLQIMSNDGASFSQKFNK